MARIGHYTEISYGVESGATGSRNDGVQCMCYASTDDEASNGNCYHCATTLSIRNEKYLKNLRMVEIITLLRKQVSDLKGFGVLNCNIRNLYLKCILMSVIFRIDCSELSLNNYVR